MEKRDKKYLIELVVFIVLIFLYQEKLIGNTLFWILIAVFAGYILENYINEKIDEVQKQVWDLENRVSDIEEFIDLDEEALKIHNEIKMDREMAKIAESITDKKF